MQVLVPGEFIDEGVIFQFDGLEADRHELELGALAEAMRGMNRIVGVCGTFAITLQHRQHQDAWAVRVVTRAPEARCYQIGAWLQWAATDPLGVTIVGGLTVLLVGYVCKKVAGDREEMRQLRGALDAAIKELGNRDQTVVDRLLTTIDKMAEGLRPSVKAVTAPLGGSAATLTVAGERTGPQTRLDIADKQAILEDRDVEVGPEADYRVLLTELDVETGGCRVALAEAPEKRLFGKITDPALALPHNSYASALASRQPLRVRAKPTLREGEIDRLFISDAPP
jgi:hypothetical protein